LNANRFVRAPSFLSARRASTLCLAEPPETILHPHLREKEKEREENYSVESWGVVTASDVRLGEKPVKSQGVSAQRDHSLFIKSFHPASIRHRAMDFHGGLEGADRDTRIDTDVANLRDKTGRNFQDAFKERILGV